MPFLQEQKTVLVKACPDTLSMKIRDATLVFMNCAATSLYLLPMAVNYFRSPS
jgi:hypothetical protein